MNIFKKLLSKLFKRKEKESETWYNNYHEKKKSRFHPESADIGGSFPMEMSSSHHR